MPNPLVPTNKAPPLMPTVFAEDTVIKDCSGIPVTPGERPGSDVRTSSERPSTPKLKGCLKSHARAHSAAHKKRLRFHNELVSDHHAPTHPVDADIGSDQVSANDDSVVTSSMFDLSSSNPTHEQKSKHHNHYVPLSTVSHSHQTIPEHVKYRLDHRMMSLKEAFQHLDVHNSGYVTQEELVNVRMFTSVGSGVTCVPYGGGLFTCVVHTRQACWYWGVHLTPVDLQSLREAHPPDLVR